jgi:hypothetical protein
MVHEYDYTGYEYVDAIDLNFGEEARLWLLTGVEFNIGSSTLVVRSNAVPFETFVLGLPEPPPRPPQERSSATRRLPKNVVQELMEEFPWLTEDDINGVASEHRHGESQRRGGGARTGEAMPLPTDAVDAVDAHDLAALLIERRDEWDMDFSDMMFYVRNLGGVWTAAHVGEPTDAASAFARQAAKPWCRHFTWPQQKGFYFSVYGVIDANKLARSWAHKANFFFELWIEGGCDWHHQYSIDDAALYVPSIEFTDWAPDVAFDSETFQRIHELVIFKPTNRV